MERATACSAGEDCAEEAEWLEGRVAGMRLWQLLGLVLSALLALAVAACCCVRLRIPRTKQEIEADHARKRLARGFRRQLARIGDRDMDDLDLRRALDRVRDALDAAESGGCARRRGPERRLGFGLDSVFRGLGLRFDEDEPAEFGAMI